MIIAQNNKLHELVSLASHEIRGPVATLLGLAGTFNHDNPADPFNAKVMKLMQEVTTKLDSMIHLFVSKSYSLREENSVIVVNKLQYNQSVNE